MAATRRHPEAHRTGRIGWLRAAVLGANDGLVSTASLMLGVAAATASAADARGAMLVAGVAGLAAGAMAMAAGEYVSVHSQADTEGADLARERVELATDTVAESNELTAIYVARGLTPELAREVAGQLMQRDALGAHARDELGQSAELAARPVQAALWSAASFACGAALPLAVGAVAPQGLLSVTLAASTIVFLALLGALAARVGGAPVLAGAWRVTLWGVLAMAVTAGVGAALGTVV